MTESCCSAGETLIFTCAGASYCGQLANRAGVQAMTNGLGQLFCLAAISAGRDAKMPRARSAAKRVVIDGCEEHCARHTIERAGLLVDTHLVLTDMGIEKQPAEPHFVVHAHQILDRLQHLLQPGDHKRGARRPSCGCGN